MRRWMTVVLAAAMTFSAAAQDSKPAGSMPVADDEATKILRAADAATKAVSAVRYQVTAEAPASRTARMKITGDVAISGGDENGFEKFRMELQLHGPEGEPRKLTLGGNGDEFWLIDESARTVHKDIDATVLGRTGRLVFLAGMREFTHPQPFSDEINAKEKKLLGKKTIGGEECHEVFVDYGRGGQQATWYFSTRDSLPRAVKRMVAGDEGQAQASETSIERLQVAPDFDAGLFKPVMPEGYTVTDEPAP